MSKATLIDTTKCIGCRSCQVTCKQRNGLPAEAQLQAGALALREQTLSARTFVVVQSSEIADDEAPGGLRYVFAKRQCMHCEDPACASACPVTAMHKTKEGPVVYDRSKCIGCRYCMLACPWGVPTAEWDSHAPRISKCTMCADRVRQAPPQERDGQSLTDEDRRRFVAAHAAPACVKQCPAGALTFGERAALLAEARRRMGESPGKYVGHVYGEREAGGTGMLYLASVPFARLGFKSDVALEPYPRYARAALGTVPPAVLGMGAVLGGAYALSRRRVEVAAAEAAAAAMAQAPARRREPHVEFAPLDAKLWTPVNLLLVVLMAFGAASFLARFALGLGGSTHLSDTYAWGLWIAFGLVRCAVATGGFATAALIYVFRRRDLYSLGRGAVLMSLLSYASVGVTLLADLGRPWHIYQLGLQAPAASAMYLASWCLVFYVTVLAAELVPLALERWRLEAAMKRWRRYAPWYTVSALTLLVYLVSRSAAWATAAFALFALLAVALRERRGEEREPVMLAIAAVTLSTVHQSSLGSLFLLMPDKLAAAWWSPLLPLHFFVSAIAAGTALLVLVELWIAKAWARPVRRAQLASVASISFWALLAFEALRLGDLAWRGQVLAAFAGPKAGLFLAEVTFGGALPLAMLASRRVRQTPGLLATAALLACGGVVLHRLDVSLLGMDLKGAMPQTAPSAYAPSAVEWGIVVGLVAATVFLFGLAARRLPVLPKEPVHQASGR